MPPPAPLTPWRDDVRHLRPMLATIAAAPLHDERFVYEPKYDGIRALVEVEPGRASGGVRIWSRLGNEKTAQFPEIVRALAQFARRLKAPVVIDGEIVALDASGQPTGFQRLQGRIHLTEFNKEQSPSQSDVAFIAFDILRDGTDDLRPLPLVARRARLEGVFGNTGSRVLRLSEFVPSDGRRLYREASERGWEGLIAKRADSMYKTGTRTADWRKLKLVRRQEFVVGGWTEPRASRSHFGALLLGYYTEPRTAGHTRSTKHQAPSLEYAGHTGTGFSEAELARLFHLLRPLEIPTCPFSVRPRTNERPHWVEPKLVAEVRFTEWTDDGRLRHPVYLGLRDDVRPEQVRREGLPPLDGDRVEATRVVRRTATAKSRSTRRASTSAAGFDGLLAQIEDLEARRRNGVLRLPDGQSLEVSNLHKVFWPAGKITKGALMRYYVRVAPYLLPAVADRPLVMKRSPNGVGGKAFYQQRAPEDVPPGVRVEVVSDTARARGSRRARGTRTADREARKDVALRRLVGGSLTTLLYMTQLAAVSQDPWFSRVASADTPDHVALDLDPMPGVAFPRVLDVARWVRDELEALRVEGVPKTSGASGLHIYIPLPPETSYEAGLLFCQIVATVVARKHPKVATVERAVSRRGRTVYIDYLQNIRGKTLATAYSARASEFGGVSAPLTWKELDDRISPSDFTIDRMPERLRSVGDLWAGLRRSKGADLRAVARYAEP